MYTTLIAVGDLAKHSGDPSWLIVDCRFDLANPGAGQQAYTTAHIPGAVYAHLDRDLAAPLTPTTGRHPLPTPDAFAATLGRWGVTPSTQVIVYDADVGMYASRLWWMLRWVGHRAVAVLDGGFKAWTAAGLPTTADLRDAHGCVHAGFPLVTNAAERTERARAAQPSTFIPQPNRDVWVDAEQLSARIVDPSWRVLDARAAERFQGVVEPIDTVAGHIPGARNHPFASNVIDGKLAPVSVLRERFDASQSGVADDRTIVMCGSGVTACHLLLALEVAGKRGARLYPGSWSEWIRSPSRPVAKGP